MFLVISSSANTISELKYKPRMVVEDSKTTDMFKRIR